MPFCEINIRKPIHNPFHFKKIRENPRHPCHPRSHCVTSITSSIFHQTIPSKASHIYRLQSI